MRRLKAAWRAFRNPLLVEERPVEPRALPPGLRPHEQGGRYRVVHLHRGHTVEPPYETNHGVSARNYYASLTPKEDEEVLLYDGTHCRGAKKG